MHGFVRASIAVALLGLVAGLAQAERLRSPWDGRQIVQTRVPYECPVAPPFAKTMEIAAYYTDSHASVIDAQKQAEFQKASAPATDLSRFTALAADAYRTKGSGAAAACVYSLLDAAAKAQAWTGKMHNFNGVYIQNWTLSGVAICYLKVRESGAGTPQQEVEIQRWFALLAARVRTYFDEEATRMGLENGISRENNHIYWAGLAVSAEGIATNDADAFRWGVETYRMGVEAIHPDGSLPQEMWRGQMTMHYHLYALGPLILLAELGEANGIDLYAEDTGAIHRLVNLCLEGLEDPTIFEKKTGIKQVVTLPYSGSDIGWAVPYVRRFPNPQLSALVAKAPWVRYSTWGGAPPD